MKNDENEDEDEDEKKMREKRSCTEKFDGFTVDGVKVKYGHYNMIHKDLERSSQDCFAKFKLYASLGLHRYNLLNETNFTLDRLKNYNIPFRACASPCYVTLVATDPRSCAQEIFQVKVAEHCLGRLDLTVPIARLSRSRNETVLPPDEKALYDLYEGTLPNWPSDSAFSDGNRFYKMKFSEVRDNGWISLYLELVVCTRHMTSKDKDLSKLMIHQVVIEGTEDEKLKSKRVILYITFKGAPEGRRGYQRAIIRRVIDKTSGYLTILGEYWSGGEEGDSDAETEMRSRHLLPAKKLVADDSEKQGEKRTTKNMTSGESSNVQTKKRKKSTSKKT